MGNAVALHDDDFYSWTEEQAKLLKLRDFTHLDIAHLIEEVEDMGVSQKKELQSNIRLILIHLLKWKYQPTHRTSSWENTILRERNNFQDNLDENRSLKSKIDELFIKAYKAARLDASSETGLPVRAFPEVCEWTIDQVLNDDFFPS